jgi:hypothetical protein
MTMTETVGLNLEVTPDQLNRGIIERSDAFFSSIPMRILAISVSILAALVLTLWWKFGRKSEKIEQKYVKVSDEEHDLEVLDD